MTASRRWTEPAPQQKAAFAQFPAPQDHVVEELRVVREGILPDPHRPEEKLHGMPEPASRRPDPALEIGMERHARRDVAEPLRGLHPGHLRIAEIAQRLLQKIREGPGIRVADDDEVPGRGAHGVAQIAGLEPDIVRPGQIVGALLRRHCRHGGAFAIVEDMDLQLDRMRVGEPFGVLQPEAHELGILAVGGEEYVDCDRAVRDVGVVRAVPDAGRQGTGLRGLRGPKVHGEEKEADIGSCLGDQERNENQSAS
jgi:hypothetical protein